MSGRDANQDRSPNFRDENGRLYLVRCFACGTTERGTENWAMAVSQGVCAWCGWGDDTDLSRKVSDD